MGCGQLIGHDRSRARLERLGRKLVQGIARYGSESRRCQRYGDYDLEEGLHCDLHSKVRGGAALDLTRTARCSA